MSLATEQILGFEGEHRFLSNFYPCRVTYEGQPYLSSEAAFQAAKSIDPEVRKGFMYVTAAESKKMGRQVALRPDWDQVKEQVMYDILMDKFTRHDYLRLSLIKTGNAFLEETNTWGDTYWGVCGGVGKNRLGALLMNVRDRLR